MRMRALRRSIARKAAWYARRYAYADDPKNANGTKILAGPTEKQKPAMDREYHSMVQCRRTR